MAYRSYFDYTAAMNPNYGFEQVATLVCPGATDPETADRSKELKIEAYELGKSLVL